MANNADTSEVNSSEVLNRFFVFFIPLSILIFSFIAVEYYADLAIYRGNLINEETQYVKVAEEAVSKEMHNGSWFSWIWFVPTRRIRRLPPRCF